MDTIYLVTETRHRYLCMYRRGGHGVLETFAMEIMRFGPPRGKEPGSWEAIAAYSN